ncbi:hypothetical protein ACFFRR_003789 [Megaselia abdita]
MKALLITLLLTIAPCLSILHPLVELYKIKFNEEQEICKKLNQTLSSIIFNYTKWTALKDDGFNFNTSSNLKFPGNFYDFEVEGKELEEFIIKEFTFFYSDDEPVLTITTKLSPNSNLSELMPDGTVKNIFPVKYHVMEFYVECYRECSFPGEIISFFLIQGERCKAEIDGNMVKNKRCWSTPGFCRGSKEQCIQNDDVDSLCYDAESGEGKRKEDPKEIHYSVDIGEQIYWKTPFRRLVDTWHSRSDPLLYRWNCTDFGERVKCHYVNDQTNPLRNEKLFNSNQELCKALNKTLNDERAKRVERKFSPQSEDSFDTFVLPGNYLDVEGDNTEDWVTKHFVFNYRLPLVYNHDKPVLNITTKIHPNTTIKDLMSDGTLRNIFPINYRITEFYDVKSYFPYYLIEGERCKAEYDQETKKLTNRKCWTTPSFCRGLRGNCILNDDENSLCYDMHSEEGKGETNLQEIHYSLHIGERIFWNVHFNPAQTNTMSYWLMRWNCTEIDEHVFCDYIDDGGRPHLTVLKTLSGL